MRPLKLSLTARKFVHRLRGRRSDGAHERGAILILALAYILIMGVVVAALTTWASGDLNNTARFNAARNTDYALSSAVEVAMNSIRYTPIEGSINANPPVACWGSATYATTSTAKLRHVLHVLPTELGRQCRHLVYDALRSGIREHADCLDLRLHRAGHISYRNDLGDPRRDRERVVGVRGRAAGARGDRRF